MATSLNAKMGEVSLKDEQTPFGKEMLKRFLFDQEWKNMNHGSFGTFPREIREKQRAYQDMCESEPDSFIRYTYPKLLDESRSAIAKVINAPTSTVVFVPNATTGVNTVLRNIVWNGDGKDEILYFSTAYGACANTIEYVCEANRNLVRSREIYLTYPLEDAALLLQFRDAIKTSRDNGRTPRLAMFDVISSLPGLRMPFEGLTSICKEEGVLSLIDGAHSVGHIPLDLSALDPDFFTSNAHKWLFVPRGCAVFYVPERNQHLIRSSLPTSHGFQPKGPGKRMNPLPPSTKGEFVTNFEFVGTIDNTNYLVVPHAIKWRERVCGGEKAIMEHNIKLAREGGKAVAKILGTKIMDNDTHSLTECSLVNVLLPLEISPTKISGVNTIQPGHGPTTSQWIERTLVEQFKTFLAIYFFQGQWWARLSGQVYLGMSDFEWAGHKLKEICERAGKDEYLKV